MFYIANGKCVYPQGYLYALHHKLQVCVFPSYKSYNLSIAESGGLVTLQRSACGS